MNIEDLPNLDFEEVRSRGGHESPVYEQQGDYIWVARDAVKELKDNANALLVAWSTKTKTGKIDTWCVNKPNYTFGTNLESVIERARELNERLR